jgi:hypothetical protein
VKFPAAALTGVCRAVRAGIDIHGACWTVSAVALELLDGRAIRPRRARGDACCRECAEPGQPMTGSARILASAVM